jgi:hypothetical protein
MGESEMAIARDRVLDDAGYDYANDDYVGDDYVGDNVARLAPVGPRLLRNFIHNRNALKKA